MMEKDYIVTADVSFTTAIGVSAKNESEAEKKAKPELKTILKTNFDGVVDELNIDISYVEQD